MFIMLRSTHVALMAAKDERIADLNRQVTVALEHADSVAERHDDFVASVSARAMELSAPKPALTMPPKKEATAIDTAIELRAGGDRAMRLYLGTWAKHKLREGASVDAVADLILKGESNDEDGVPA